MVSERDTLDHGRIPTLKRIKHPPYWTEDAINHLLASHDVTAEEVEDVLYGIDGDDPDFRIRRDGEYYVFEGVTGDGRYLRIVGEFLSDQSFRPFGARDMTPTELRSYRRKGK